MSDSLGFPQELDYHMLKSMFPSRKTEYRKAPTNSQTFTQAGQEINLVLNKMENSFYDPSTLCVCFTVDYNGITANGGKSFLLGNAYSHFSRQVVKPASGQPLETIDNPSLLVNSVMNMTTDGYEKLSLSTTQGFNSEEPFTNLGALIENSAQTKTQSYSIPLVGVLNAAKFIPAFITDLQIDLTLNNIANFIVSATNLADSNPTSYTIRNVELVCEALTLESSGMQMLMQMYPGMMKIKSQSFLYGSSTLVSGQQAGTYDITYSHSLNSLKQFIWWSSPANAWELNYAGVNPNLSSWNLIIGSTSYPQQPVKAERPNECFMQNQKSFGSLYSTSHCGSATKLNFAKASTAAGEYYAYNTKPANMAGFKVDANANKWYQALDLELINNLNSTLYNGISTKGSTNTLRLNVGRQLAAQTHAVHFYSHFDVILEFDYVNGVINVIQ